MRAGSETGAALTSADRLHTLRWPHPPPHMSQAFLGVLQLLQKGNPLSLVQQYGERYRLLAADGYASWMDYLLDQASCQSRGLGDSCLCAFEGFGWQPPVCDPGAVAGGSCDSHLCTTSVLQLGVCQLCASRTCFHDRYRLPCGGLDCPVICTPVPCPSCR